MATHARWVKTAKCFDDLTDIDKTFILKYIADGFKPYEAYRLTHPKASPESALKNCAAYRKALQPYIDEKLKERYEELNITAEHIIQELAEIGFAPKGDEEYNATVKLKALDLMQKQLGLQNKNVKVDADVNAAVTFVDDLKPDENKSE